MPDPRLKEIAVREAWVLFNKGDHLSDIQIKILIESAEGGASYLRARGESLAFQKTITDLEALKGHLQARRDQKRQ